MPVEMPSFADAWLAARFSDDPALLLVTVSHPAMETVRLVRNTEDVVSEGETFKASWLEIDWVNDDGNMPRCALSVPNVDDYDVGQRYLRLADAPQVTLAVIANSMPDEPITKVFNLELRGIALDSIAITGDLQGKDHSSEPYGTIIVVPSRFPALFRRQKKT